MSISAKTFRKVELILIALGFLSLIFSGLIDRASLLISATLFALTLVFEYIARRIEKSELADRPLVDAICHKITSDASIATWYDQERSIQINGKKVSVLIHGNTGMVKKMQRPMATVLRLPSWEVAILILEKKYRVKPKQLSRTLDSTRRYLQSGKIKWACLVIVCTRGFETQVLKLVDKLTNPELGLVLVNCQTNSLHWNNIQVGRKIAGIIKPLLRVKLDCFTDTRVRATNSD